MPLTGGTRRFPVQRIQKNISLASFVLSRFELCGKQQFLVLKSNTGSVKFFYRGGKIKVTAKRMRFRIPV